MKWIFAFLGYIALFVSVCTGTQYRVPLIVDNSANADTLLDYAVPFILSAANFDFTHAAFGGADLQAKKLNGASLYHCLRSDLDWSIDTAWVYVRFDSIYGGIGDTLGWLYFGAGSSTENCDSTFLFYVDFNTEFPLMELMKCRTIKPHRAAITELPIVDEGGAADWDYHIREIGNVLLDFTADDSIRYRTWYTGWKTNQGQDGDTYIGYAYSSDGITWTKYGKCTDFLSQDPYIIRNTTDNLTMYYEIKTGAFCCIGRAISIDGGSSWTAIDTALSPKAGGSPNNWQVSDVSSPAVLLDISGSDTTWYLFYEGRGALGGEIGCATSTDGITFTQPDDTCFGPGAAGEWDDEQVISDDILYDTTNSLYWLSYHGWGGTAWRAGLAYSSSLNGSWTRLEFNPITPAELQGAPRGLQFYYDPSYQNGSYIFHYLLASDAPIYRGYPCDTTNSSWPFSNLTLEMKPSGYGRVWGDGSTLYMEAKQYAKTSISIYSDSIFTGGIIVDIRCRFNGSVAPGCKYRNLSIGYGNLYDANGGTTDWYFTVPDSGYYQYSRFQRARIYREPGNVEIASNWDAGDSSIWKTWSTQSFAYSIDDTLKWLYNGVIKSEVKDVTYSGKDMKIVWSAGAYSNGTGDILETKWIRVRGYAFPEPTISLGAEEVYEGLPSYNHGVQKWGISRWGGISRW